MGTDLLQMNSRSRATIIEALRMEYPSGTRVELLSMNDPYRKLPLDLKGTVTIIDDIGTIL